MDPSLVLVSVLAPSLRAIHQVESNLVVFASSTIAHSPISRIPRWLRDWVVATDLSSLQGSSAARYINSGGHCAGESLESSRLQKPPSSSSTGRRSLPCLQGDCRSTATYLRLLPPLVDFHLVL